MPPTSPLTTTLFAILSGILWKPSPKSMFSSPITTMRRILSFIFALLTLHELTGRPFWFFRWSVLRMAWAGKSFMKLGHAGDGRESLCLEYVKSKVKPGDVSGILQAIDNFALNQSFLMNVGQDKGKILDQAVKEKSPQRVLELGTYIGYSSIRMSQFLPPNGKIYTVEMSEHNYNVAKAMIEYAGLSNKIEIVLGTLNDQGGKTLHYLKTQTSTFDLVFIDHWKEVYLPDTIRLLDAKLLSKGSIIVADNVIVPGAPKYLAWMKQVEGKVFTSVENWSFLEYQSLIKDMVLVSTFLGNYDEYEKLKPVMKAQQSKL
jgi:catechol O-methyltransferase